MALTLPIHRLLISALLAVSSSGLVILQRLPSGFALPFARDDDGEASVVDEITVRELTGLNNQDEGVPDEVNGHVTRTEP